MAITHRKGNYNNFVPTKMAPAEIAVVTSNDPGTSDGKGIYVAFSSGDVKRLATADEMHDFVQNEIIDQTADIVQEIHEGIADDVERAEAAAETAESCVYTFTDPNSDGAIVITGGVS